ncbi:hypothetical protein MITS9504_00109 [Synechococcus sp. MIT S9504]|nr:hypothetical protein MITS9504_00109 [Synechococcus sp. MIT S9504]
MSKPWRLILGRARSGHKEGTFAEGIPWTNGEGLRQLHLFKLDELAMQSAAPEPSLTERRNFTLP